MCMQLHIFALCIAPAAFHAAFANLYSVNCKKNRSHINSILHWPDLLICMKQPSFVVVNIYVGLCKRGILNFHTSVVCMSCRELCIAAPAALQLLKFLCISSNFVLNCKNITMHSLNPMALARFTALYEPNKENVVPAFLYHVVNRTICMCSIDEDFNRICFHVYLYTCSMSRRMLHTCMQLLHCALRCLICMQFYIQSIAKKDPQHFNSIYMALARFTTLYDENAVHQPSIFVVVNSTM